jgi:hypothetical protein
MPVRFGLRMLLFVFLLALNLAAQTVTCADSRNSQGAFPPIPTVIDNTCTVAPVKFAGQIEQSNFDLFGWLTFLALNWPANAATCAADPNSSILSGSGPLVWQTYSEDSDIFVGRGLMPVPWCNNWTTAHTALLARLPAKVRALAQQHPEVHLFLHQDSKVSGLLKSNATLSSGQLQAILEAVGGPLTDQNGRFVRYEIHVNQDEYNYLRNNGLWHLAGLKQYNQPISFPFEPGPYGQTGAIEIKAAWKVLCTTSSCKAQDDPTHFFTQQAIVYNDSTGAPSPGPNPVTVGLVGWHVTHKIAAQQTWAWITFQQVENTKSFFNNQCNFQCQPNTQTANKPYTELNPNGTPINQPVQVVPYPTQDNSADQYNQAFQKLLGTSVWRWYQQISVQWTGETPPNPKPLILGNPVLETYIQGSSSCLACHNLSTVTTKQGSVPADFSFLFLGAK